MNEKDVNPLVKTGLELGPIILFFVVYSRIKDQDFTILGQTYQGFIVATALFIPLILLTTGILWLLTGKLSKMQLFTAVLVTVFGGLSVYFNDERFFKMKPTMIYRRFCAFFFGLAVLNEIVWRTMSTDAWVNFKTFGLTAAVFVFMMTQMGVISKYAIEDES